jgi:hypothetical protein
VILDSLIDQVQSLPRQSPPIHLWHPELSGDIDIKIMVNGDWLHEGALIERQSLVDLFASILRRESDGKYYLVTPVEKWRIQVADAPLMIVDFDVLDDVTGKQFMFKSNVSQKYLLSKQYPLQLSPGDDVPILTIDNGLTAKLSRNMYYQLVELAQPKGNELLLESGGELFLLGFLND